MRDGPLDVVFLPYGEDNEYHSLLADTIRQQGARTHAGDLPVGLTSVAGLVGLLCPLFRYAFHDDDIDVIHVVWSSKLFLTTGFTPSDFLNKLLTLIRGVILVANVYLVRMAGIRVVWTVHNKSNHEKYHHRVNLLVNRLFAASCDALTVECDDAKETVVETFAMGNPGKVAVIPEGNYIDAYPNTITQSEARTRLGIDRDETVVLYFGKIRPYKGVPDLVDAYERARTEQSRLLVVGSPMNPEMDRTVRDRIGGASDIEYVPEFVPNDEIQVYMNAADVVALPYRDILTSGAGLLAASFGRPVVAPAMGCLPAILADEGRVLYDPEAPDGLTDALADALGTPGADLRGRANLRRAKEFAWKDIGRVTCELYTSII